MPLDENIDEIETVENLGEEGLSRIIQHRGEYAKVDVFPESSKTEWEFFNGAAYSKSLKKDINYGILVSMGGNVPEEYRDAVLAHEIGEAMYMKASHTMDEAHKYGIGCEKAYAEAFLDDSEAFLEWIRKERQKDREENGFLFDDE